MKKFIAIAAIASLAACSGNEAADADADTDAAATEEVAAVQIEADPEGVTPAVGAYTATMADGTTMSYTTNEVGVYTATTEAGETKGTFTSEGNRSCFDPAGDDPEQPETCWNNSVPAPDGSYTATNDAGETVTVTPAA